MPVCQDNVATTCKADGSGYTPGGMTCGPLTCSGGACVEPIFAEDFEDGNTTGWTIGSGTMYTRGAVQGGANGTEVALAMATTETSATFGSGLFWAFSSGVQPRGVSWWTKTSAISSLPQGYLVLTGAAPTEIIAFVYFSSSAFCRGHSGTSTCAAYTADTWYHVELRDIDWTAKTFDFYLDGVAVQRGAAFYSAATEPAAFVSRIDLYTGGGSPTNLSYWDEIELFP
jgi:hypothetical protein